MQRRIFAVMTALCLSLPALALTTADLVGTYEIIKGVNPDGSTYGGTVKVTPDASGGVTIRYDDGSVGVGMIDGNNLLLGMVYEKRSVVGKFTWQRPGLLNGVWIVRTEPGTGIENWQKQ